MRLIDADKIEINEECMFSGKGVKDFLDAIPPAYDVDKVAEHVNDLVKPTAEYRHNFCGTVTDEHCAKYDGCESCMAEQICKVVKSGGIE